MIANATVRNCLFVISGASGVQYSGSSASGDQCAARTGGTGRRCSGRACVKLSNRDPRRGASSRGSGAWSEREQLVLQQVDEHLGAGVGFGASAEDVVAVLVVIETDRPCIAFL